MYLYKYMTGYAGSWHFVGTPQSPQKILHISTQPTENTPTRTGLTTRGSETVFQWDVWIGVGSSVETAGSLRIPETRRTPSLVPNLCNAWYVFKNKKISLMCPVRLICLI